MENSAFDTYVSKLLFNFNKSYNLQLFNEFLKLSKESFFQNLNLIFNKNSEKTFSKSFDSSKLFNSFNKNS